MTLIINLYGGPGVGKSTNAARIFAALKERGVEAEYVPEYIKNWVWEQRKITPLDQYYFFGNQVRSELRLIGKVDVIVTDSPVPLTGFYVTIAGTESQQEAFPHMVRGYIKDIEDMGHQNLHFFLKRVAPFSQNGRIHTEAESIGIDWKQRAYLKSVVGVEFEEVNGDADGAMEIVERVIAKLSEKKVA